MMIKTLLAAALLAPTTIASAQAAPASGYQVAATIPVRGDGGWDYARVDGAAHRLYVARSSTVSVVDTEAARSLAPIGSIARGHAVVPVRGGRLLVTSGNDASVRLLDAASGRELGRVMVGAQPDAAILSDDGRTAYVMNAEDGTVSVVDVDGMRVERTITVKPALEYGAVVGSTLFVADEDANEIEVVDTVAGVAGAPIALPGCEAPSGVAYDAAGARLIAACANGKAAVVDTRSRRLTGLVDIGLGPDAVILDAKRRLAFIPCGKDGTLDVLGLVGKQVRRIARVKTAVGARTGALDPVTGAIYLPTASFGPPATSGGRPTISPGTFRVLVVKGG